MNDLRKLEVFCNHHCDESGALQVVGAPRPLPPRARLPAVKAGKRALVLPVSAEGPQKADEVGDLGAETTPATGPRRPPRCGPAQGFRLEKRTRGDGSL